jgi:hypothetical protein
MTNQHPGDDWPNIAVADHNKLSVVINGARSVVSKWPPTAACEHCGESLDVGYAGPTATDVVRYPNPSIRFYCESCIRQVLGAGNGEFLGHQCQKCRFDDVDSHVEGVIMTAGFLAWPEPQQFAELEAQSKYRERGFILEAVTPKPPNGVHRRSTGTGLPSTSIRVGRWSLIFDQCLG